MAMIIEKTYRPSYRIVRCRECGAQFETNNNRKVYCSPQCADHAKRRMRPQSIFQRRAQHIETYEERHKQLTKLTAQAKQLGLSYGEYAAILERGLNPLDFKREPKPKFAPEERAWLDHILHLANQN